MTWGAALFVSVFAQSVANILNRVVMRDATKDTWTYAALQQILSSLFIGAYVFLASGFTMPPIIELWPWFTASVFLNVAAVIFQNQALRTAEVSFFTILTSSRALVSIFAATLVLGEHISLLQGLGVIILLSAIFVAFERHFELKWEPWMRPALLYALCSGSVFIADVKIIGHTVDAVSYSLLAYLAPGLLTAALRPRVVREAVSLIVSPQIWAMLLYSAVYGFMVVMLYLAYQYGGDASQVMPLRQSSIILTVILGALFLAERSRLIHKFIGAVLAVVAVYLIAIK